MMRTTLGILAIGLLAACETTGGGHGGGGGKTNVPAATADDVKKAGASWWQSSPDALIQRYCYPDPIDTSKFGNTFLLAPNMVVSVTLYAKSRGGKFDGDQFMIFNLSGARLSLFDLDRDYSDEAIDTCTASVSTSGDNSWITVRHPNGNRITLSRLDLARGRIQTIKESFPVGPTTYKTTYQGRDMASLFFTEAAASAWLDPSAPVSSMSPIYVVPAKQRQADGSWTNLTQMPIGDSGYILVQQPNGTLMIQQAK